MPCAHSCLQTGAQAATSNVVLFRHLDTEHCRQRLTDIRAKDAQAGIMLITESLFSMNSDTPDIAALQALAHEFSATLLVDAAHDPRLPPDRAAPATSGSRTCWERVDLVMGSFSKTFGSNGGFVATNSREVKEYLRFYSPSCTFSNALSPVQVAVITQRARDRALQGRPACSATS